MESGADLIRCSWCLGAPEYIRYHDEEWGRPVYDDRKLFEFLVLESAQAGLSWLTILRKREGYRKAFAGFEPVKVARFTEKDAERLLQDPGIIRNRQKIVAAIGNARIFLDIQKEFGSFSDFIWGYLPDRKPIVNSWNEQGGPPARTELSDRISADLKKRGFKFFGSTICYAHMQATGMVNDHREDCWVRKLTA
ncbi:DNA-3-methyladenine glycosylase I [Anseongella ginsenosidimutans]|uniref:DNA-3-methyladenine glycosylase I n=2 Tax=Anseongella ginsenosidimutans TaxID=496056 RepID=A0A4R3KW16_9SPHI|nr:DNA-3-methyladenine glycosylase I [Anseongella ginsenosidimutans]TCS89154.1 DNA-3-methyladenine glycosylase I [Anseongella ginsenosidimutans]